MLDGSVDSNTLEQAPQIENLEVLEVLGRGGMAIVYKARQRDMDRFVALKVLSQTAFNGDENFRRFQQEARLTSTLDHENIVKVLSFGISTDEQPYLIMEYIDGRSLADELKQTGCLNLLRFKNVFLPILSALEAAHQAGLVHRDLKPGNIMLSSADDGNETVKLVDFGIAKVLQAYENGDEPQRLTRTGALLGSFSYISPEQSQGKKVDCRSDIYSISCVMYEALSGEPPFTGETAFEVMRKHSMEAPPTVSELSRKTGITKELAAVTIWALAKDQADRPQTAAELSRKLNSVLEKVSLEQVPKSNGSTKENRFRKNGMVLSFIVLSLLISILTIGIVNRKQPNEKTVIVLRKTPDQEFEKEERDLIESIRRSEKRYGPSDARLSPKLLDLAKLYSDYDRYSKAEELYRRLLEMKQEEMKSDPDDPDIAKCMTYLAGTYLSEGKFQKSEALYRRTAAIWEKVSGSDSKVEAQCLLDLANCLGKEQKNDEAQRLLERGIANLESYGPNELLNPYPCVELALIYELKSKYNDAERLMNLAQSKVEKTDNCNYSAALDEIAKFYRRRGLEAKAKKMELSSRILSAKRRK